MRMPSEIASRIAATVDAWSKCNDLEPTLEQRIDADLAEVREALEKIRGEDLSTPDADGLVVDAVCTYCDQSSMDGCTEDCPRSIASAALASLEVK